MHPEAESPSNAFARFLQARPWIWILIAYVAFMACSISFVVIAIKHKEPAVPLNYPHGR
jgi:hypothetical protein